MKTIFGSKSKWLLVCSMFLVASSVLAGEKEQPAQRVIERLLGQQVKNVKFELKELRDGEKESFSIEAANGVLTIEGNSQVALCYGFRCYMQEACRSMATWAGKNVVLPDRWPDYQLSSQATPYTYRYFLNVCTYGYTAPYWDWERWEQEIDWMALHGVNFPLATVAAEAIAERVGLRLGL